MAQSVLSPKAVAETFATNEKPWRWTLLDSGCEPRRLQLQNQDSLGTNVYTASDV